MSEPILEVKNLKTYFYTDNHIVPAVDGVDFSMKKGEILGIVGESGCGKSVTSMSILRLLDERQAKIQPESSILFKGQELTTMNMKDMRRIRGEQISMIFQDSMTSLNPVKTIEAQMVGMLRLHRKISKKEASGYAVEMLRKVGIPEPETRIKAYPHQLSGGMRQRVLIAMALSCNPEILIADEPTTALDVTIQQQILDLIREIRDKSNTGVMLITHDMGVVAEMADNILVMYCGNVVEYADAQSIFKNPMHPYTKALLKSIPRLDKEENRLNTIDGAVPNWNNMPKGCRFAPRCPYRTERCECEQPELYQNGKTAVRCFLYEKGTEDAR